MAQSKQPKQTVSISESREQFKREIQQTRSKGRKRDEQGRFSGQKEGRGRG